MATAVQVESLWNGLTDNSGQPLAAGRVFTYAAGTTTPVSLFTASDKSTSATNPLILDANGKAQVWADGRYKFEVRTAANVLLYTLDNLLYGFDDTTVLYGGVSTGSANAQVVSVPATVTSYANGQTVSFVAGFTNTGATTLQFNSLSATNLVKGPTPSSLQAGDLIAGQLYTATYHGGTFRLENFNNVGPGTAASPAIYIAGDSNTGIFGPAADNLGFATNGTVRATIDSSGNFCAGNGGDATAEGTPSAGARTITVKSTGNYASLNIITREASANAAYIQMCKTRGSAANNFTAVNNGDGLGAILFQGANGTDFRQAATIEGQSDGTPSVSSMPGRLIFTTTPVGSITPLERLRIGNSGNIGMGGAVESTQKLTVYGDDTTSTNYSFAARSSTTLVMCVRNDGRVGIGTGAPSNQLTLSTDSAAKPTTNTWTITSDERIKTNVQSYSKGLAEICQVNPITYDYNGKGGIPAGPGGVSILAQELQPVFPECVGSYKAKLNEDDENETDIFNYNGHAITFALINAVKELNAKVEALEALEARVAALETV